MSKLVLRLLALSCAVLAAVPAAAVAKAGALDQAFGRNGRATIQIPTLNQPLFPAKQWEAAAAPSGKVVVATNERVFRLAGGELDPVFGMGGQIALTPQPDTRFLLGGVAVDSRNRVLVGGTSESTLGPTPGPQTEPPMPGPPRAWATVYRFLPGGSPDTSFGVNGVLVTDLGQKPPSESVFGPFPYATPAVKVSGLAVDGEDRPVLLGSSAARVIACGGVVPYLGYVTRTWVARLTSGGTPDPDFGVDGVYTNPGSRDPSHLALSPNGKIIFSNPTEELCPRPPAGAPEVVDFLGATGRAGRASFFTARGPASVLQALAVDSRNRIVVLARETEPLTGGATSGVYLRRLKANGEIDSSFGQGGTAKPALSPEGAGSLALDQGGRILVAASTATSGTDSNRLVVARLGTLGRPDRSFGKRGRATVAFDTKTVLARPDVLLDARGRIVVSAPIGKPGSEYAAMLAFARFKAH